LRHRFLQSWSGAVHCSDDKINGNSPLRKTIDAGAAHWADDAITPRWSEDGIRRPIDAGESLRPTVAVLDDDDAVLRSIQRALAGQGYDARLYSSPALLLAEIRSIAPWCLIADLVMPGMTGLDVQRALAIQGLRCPIIFVSGHGDIRTSVQAMLGGAVDFLTKPLEFGELLGALERAISRDRHFREIEDRLVLMRRRVESLTPREREVFKYVVDGLLNKQIAADLGISEKTVKVHRGRVMRKMSVRSVAQLVRAAAQLEGSAGSGQCPVPVPGA
jgi:FixJ family two-component response regulator